MTKHREADQYSEQEAERRRDEIVRRMLSTPPKPHANTKPAKRRKPARKKIAPKAD
jgi:hypothetical protein